MRSRVGEIGLLVATILLAATSSVEAQPQGSGCENSGALTYLCSSDKTDERNARFQACDAAYQDSNRFTDAFNTANPVNTGTIMVAIGICTRATSNPVTLGACIVGRLTLAGLAGSINAVLELLAVNSPSWQEYTTCNSRANELAEVHYEMCCNWGGCSGSNFHNGS